MPFAGKWAYNVFVNPPYTDANSSHPSVHLISGGSNWATDLYAATGTPVRLHLASEGGGTTTYSWKSTSTSCGTSTGVNVYVNGELLGWIYFAHLVGAVTSGPITDGMSLGTVGNHACAPGPHVHLEVKSNVGFACWADLGRPGTSAADGQLVGRTGATAAAANQRAC